MNHLARGISIYRSLPDPWRRARTLDFAPWRFAGKLALFQ
jgi:hypothetical protein